MKWVVVLVHSSQWYGQKNVYTFGSSIIKIQIKTSTYAPAIYDPLIHLYIMCNGRNKKKIAEISLHHWLLRNRFKIRDYCITKVFQYFYHFKEKNSEEKQKIPLKFICMQKKTHICTKQNHESIKRFICNIVHIGITQLSPEQIEIFRISLKYFVKCVQNSKQ